MGSLRVTGHGVDLGESLRGRVEERMAATLTKYLDTHMNDSCSGHVTLRRDGAAYRTDCVLHLVSGLTIEAMGAAHDARSSFEQTADKLETRLRRYKHRLKQHASGRGDDAAIEAAYRRVRRTRGRRRRRARRRFPPAHRRREHPHAPAGPDVGAALIASGRLFFY